MFSTKTQFRLPKLPHSAEQADGDGDGDGEERPEREARHTGRPEQPSDAGGGAVGPRSLLASALDARAPSASCPSPARALTSVAAAEASKLRGPTAPPPVSKQEHRG